MRPRPAVPKPGQESVWDYPRPAVAERTSKHLRVVFGGVTVAETRAGVRTLETSHPPTYYFPRSDVLRDVLRPVSGQSLCEWKGRARYFDVAAGGHRAERAAWSYEAPTPPFALIAGYVAFMPAAMEACFVDEERARPQEGGFYGGWITDDLAGPFKGGEGTRFW